MVAAVVVAALIAANRTQLGVPHVVSCRLVGVSESWFYKWRDRTPTLTELRRPAAAAVAPADLLGRDFTAAAPNQKWSGDFEGKLQA